MKIAITGATGNMGREVMKEIGKLDGIESIKALTRNAAKAKKILKKTQCCKITEFIEGSLGTPGIAEQLIDGVDWVLNIGSVIPPQSDQSPRAAIECNEVGLNLLVDALERMEDIPKLIHISTVALYGNRNSRHLWGRVGDPLLVSPLDIYSATKLRGEFRVMNSKLPYWTVLRQTAMLHDNMLSGNISDGLMFHTCFNAPLEWVTAHDSGVLIANILKEDMAGNLGDKFWRRCFNIGGGEANRLIGFETLDEGFRMIGGSAKDFFEPNYNAVRNFHGVWYTDSDELNDMFHFVSQTTQDYWKHIASMHKIYGMAKIVPKGLIRSAVIKRLFKNYNSPAYWYKHNDTAKLTAFFGSKEAYEALPKKWKDFPLLKEGKNEWGEPADYQALRSNPVALDYGFHFDKPDSEIDIADLKSVAEAHGGKLTSENFARGDVYAPLTWQTQDGEEFTANAYSVLRGGHWYSRIYRENVWDFDRLSKKDKIFAQIWYDSHEENENYVYSLDENFRAHITTEAEE